MLTCDVQIHRLKCSARLNELTGNPQFAASLGPALRQPLVPETGKGIFGYVCPQIVWPPKGNKHEGVFFEGTALAFKRGATKTSVRFGGVVVHFEINPSQLERAQPVVPYAASPGLGKTPDYSNSTAGLRKPEMRRGGRKVRGPCN